MYRYALVISIVVLFISSCMQSSISGAGDISGQAVLPDSLSFFVATDGNDNDTESNFCTGLFNRWITGAEEEYARLRTDGGPEIGGEVDGQLYGVDVTSELNDHMLTLTITADEGSNFWITGTTLAGSYDNGGVVPVPEPATMFLMGIGLLAIGNVGIRIKKS